MLRSKPTLADIVSTTAFDIQRSAASHQNRYCVSLYREVDQFKIFTTRHYASAVYDVVMCPSVCLSATNRCCVETTGRIGFWHGGFLPSPTAHCL